MKKKRAEELIDFCRKKLGTPYVYGAKGEILTEDRLKLLKNQNPTVYTAAYMAKARKYIGKNCTDCSGLISWFTGILRGSSHYHDTAEKRVPIASLDETMTGWALWKPGHIGIYIGNGYCIEARGIDYGTVKTKAAAASWQKVLKLCDIDYSQDSGTIKGKEGFWLSPDKKSWKYRLSDGKWAAGGWYWLKEQTGGTWGWYLFDQEGNMQVGCHNDGTGEKFFLCPEKGIHEGQCMVTDRRGALKIAEKYDFTKKEYIL